MKVLVACEYSGVVRDAFISRGHDAMSCDLLDTEAPGPHYVGDVRDIIGFGHSVTKTTCLWLKELPNLIPTNIVSPSEVRVFPNGKRMSEYYYQTSLRPHHLRGHERSITFKGIADAMADQWGNLCQ